MQLWGITLERANDLKTISNWLVLLSRCVWNLKPFSVNKSRSWAPQTHTRDIINILLTEFKGRTVSYGSSFFPFDLWPAKRLGHKSRRKNSVRNLQYGPWTRLVRDLYVYWIQDISGKTGMNWHACRSAYQHTVLNHAQSKCQTQLKSIHGLSPIEFCNQMKLISHKNDVVRQTKLKVSFPNSWFL